MAEQEGLSRMYQKEHGQYGLDEAWERNLRYYQKESRQKLQKDFLRSGNQDILDELEQSELKPELESYGFGNSFQN